MLLLPEPASVLDACNALDAQLRARIPIPSIITDAHLRLPFTGEHTMTLEDRPDRPEIREIYCYLPDRHRSAIARALNEVCHARQHARLALVRVDEEIFAAVSHEQGQTHCVPMRAITMSAARRIYELMNGRLGAPLSVNLFDTRAALIVK